MKHILIQNKQKLLFFQEHHYHPSNNVNNNNNYNFYYCYYYIYSVRTSKYNLSKCVTPYVATLTVDSCGAVSCAAAAVRVTRVQLQVSCRNSCNSQPQQLCSAVNIRHPSQVPRWLKG